MGESVRTKKSVPLQNKIEYEQTRIYTSKHRLAQSQV